MEKFSIEEVAFIVWRMTEKIAIAKALVTFNYDFINNKDEAEHQAVGLHASFIDDFEILVPYETKIHDEYHHLYLIIEACMKSAEEVLSVVNKDIN